MPRIVFHVFPLWRLSRNGAVRADGYTYSLSSGRTTRCVLLRAVAAAAGREGAGWRRVDRCRQISHIILLKQSVLSIFVL